MILQQSATFERKSDGAIAIQCSVCFFSGFSTCHCSTNVSSSTTTSSSSSASSTSSKAGNSSKIPAQNTPHQPPSKRGQGGLSGSGSSSGDRNTSGSSRIQLKKCDDKLEVNSNASAAAATASITGATSTDKAEVVTSEVLEELAALRPGNNIYIYFLHSPRKTI